MFGHLFLLLHTLWKGDGLQLGAQTLPGNCFLTHLVMMQIVTPHSTPGQHMILAAVDHIQIDAQGLHQVIQTPKVTYAAYHPYMPLSFLELGRNVCGQFDEGTCS